MDNVHLSTTIKALCKSQNITVKKLLEDCHVSRNFIYDLEKKGQMPSIDKLEAIADYLGCSVDYLLGRTTNSSTNASKTNELIFPTNDRDSLNELQEFVSGLSEEQIKDLIDYIEFKKFQQEKNRKETK